MFIRNVNLQILLWCVSVGWWQNELVSVFWFSIVWQILNCYVSFVFLFPLFLTFSTSLFLFFTYSLSHYVCLFYHHLFSNKVNSPQISGILWTLSVKEEPGPTSWGVKSIPGSRTSLYLNQGFHCIQVTLCFSWQMWVALCRLLDGATYV